MIVLTLSSVVAAQPVHVDQSFDAAAKLSDLDAALQAGDLNDAALLIDQLLEDHAHQLVPIQPYRFVPVREALRQRSGRDEQLLRMLQQRDEAIAELQLKQAGADPIKLEAVASDYPWTLAGQRAALRAGGMWLESATFDRARVVLATLLRGPIDQNMQLEAHRLSVITALYQHEMTRLSEHGRAMVRLGGAKQLASLKTLAQRISPRREVVAVVDHTPRRRLRVSPESADAKVLSCSRGKNGSTIWQARPGQFDEQWKSARWGGRPLVDRQTVYIPVRQRGPANLVQMHIVALDIEDGSMRWRQRVFSRSKRSRRGEAMMCELAIGPAGLFARVDRDALCRLSPEDGTRHWVSLMNAPAEASSDDVPSARDQSPISDWTRQRLSVQPAGLVMIEAPRQVAVYDPIDGQVLRRIDAELWHHPMHLRPTGQGMLAFGERIVRIDGRTLQVQWVSPGGFDPRSFEADQTHKHRPTIRRPVRSPWSREAARPINSQRLGGRIHHAPLDQRVR